MNASQLARQAAMLFGANVITRALAFFGVAFAAKCLGPSNLGVSALVQSVVLGVATLAGGGLDNIAVRRISAQPGGAKGVARQVLIFRSRVLAGVIPIGLILVAWLAAPDHVFAWTMGLILLAATVLTSTFVFQGMEALPLQAWLSVLTGTVAAAIYFGVFRPGMPAGSDLAVSGLTTLAASVLGWWLAGSITENRGPPAEIPTMATLLKEARPYWLLVIVVYCYSTLQIPLVGALVGEEKLGIYRSALMLAAGLDLLYGSLNALLLPRLVRWKQLGATLFRRKQGQLFAASLGAGICVATASIMAAPMIYRLMLGPRFAGGAAPFQILALARSVVFVGQIYSNSLIALGLDRQFLWASIAGAVFSVIANIYAVLTSGLMGAAVVSLAAEVIVCGLCFVFTHLHFRGQQVEPTPTVR